MSNPASPSMLYRYLAVEAPPNIAERYTNAIVSYCEGLSTFPQRGTAAMKYALIFG
jgi:hypothetical protein